MNKQEFVSALTKKLSEYPEKEVEERISFYVEMIEDQMEEGVSEEEAVSKIGSVDSIASQIMEELGHTENTQTQTKAEPEIPYEIPYETQRETKSRSKREMSPWIIVLLILGSPIWFSLAIAAVSVIFSLFVVLWSVIISFWSVFAALLGCAIGGVVAGVVLLVVGNGFVGTVLTGAALVCAGLSIFAFFGCKYATAGSAWIVKQTVLGIKNSFKKKEEA